MKLKLDLHDIYNRGGDIDHALRAIIAAAIDKKAPLVETIHWEGLGRTQEACTALSGSEGHQGSVPRVEKDSNYFGRVFVHFRWKERRYRIRLGEPRNQARFRTSESARTAARHRSGVASGAAPAGAGTSGNCGYRTLRRRRRTARQATGRQYPPPLCELLDPGLGLPPPPPDLLPQPVATPATSTPTSRQRRTILIPGYTYAVGRGFMGAPRRSCPLRRGPQAGECHRPHVR